MIQSMMKNKDDKDAKVVSLENTSTNPETGVETKLGAAVNTRDGKTWSLNKNGNVEQGSVGLAGQSNAQESETLQKAKIVMQNPDKFSKEQVDYAKSITK
jgi:hypothetical protein